MVFCIWYRTERNGMSTPSAQAVRCLRQTASSLQTQPPLGVLSPVDSAEFKGSIKAQASILKRRDLHPDVLQMITLGVIISLNVDSVQFAQNISDVDQRQVTSRGNSSRRYQLAKVATCNGIGCTRPKQCTHDPVDRAGRPAALRMAQHY